MYNYEAEKAFVFTDEGQRKFLEIRDRVKGLLAASGTVRLGEAIRGTTGSNWEAMACVDRLVELGELREIAQPSCAAQNRIFVAR